MNRFAHIAILFALFGIGANAQINSLVYNADFELIDAPSLIYANPAMRHDVYLGSQTSISLGYHTRHDDEAVVMQMGNGDKLGFVDIQSVSNRSDATLWGKAKFVAGRYENMLYNETSDYQLLAPYNMGDTVGGNLKTQTYIFGGGLMHQIGETDFAFGLDADYRAMLEYRQHDPRPRNTTSALHASVGFLYNIDNQIFALHIDGFRYKQTNEVKFFNEANQPIVYHYTGLGTDYARFRGRNIETYYNGYNGGGGLSYKLGSGISATVQYHYQTFEKIISTLNELPMAQTMEHIAALQLVCRNIFVTADMSRRTGRENIFGDAANNIYPKLSYVEQYKQKRQNAMLTGVLPRMLSSHSLTLRADVGAKREEQTYGYPVSKMAISTAVVGLHADDLFSCGKNRLYIALSGQYNAPFNTELSLATSVATPQPTIIYYNNMSHAHTQLNITTRLQHPIERSGIDLFATINASTTHYKSNSSNALSVSIGACF